MIYYIILYYTILYYTILYFTILIRWIPLNFGKSDNISSIIFNTNSRDIWWFLYEKGKQYKPLMLSMVSAWTICWHKQSRSLWFGMPSRAFGVSEMGRIALQWRNNDHGSISNHQPHDCFPSRLFRRRSKKASNLRVAGLCAGNSPVNGEFPAQRASNAEKVSIWWRRHCFLCPNSGAAISCPCHW